MGNLPLKKSKEYRELEQHTKPTGLYATCPWDDKAAKRLILDRKIAPRYPGLTEKYPGMHECEICFMYYANGLNCSQCCKKLICTECLLQIKLPKTQVSCPFCTRENFATTCNFSGEMLKEIESSTSVDEAEPISAKKMQYASAADRHQIEKDVEELVRHTDNILLEEITTGQSWNHIFNTTGTDASRIEELMLREALRRSLVDTKDSNEDDETSKTICSSYNSVQGPIFS